MFTYILSSRITLGVLITAFFITLGILFATLARAFGSKTKQGTSLKYNYKKIKWRSRIMHQDSPEMKDVVNFVFH